MGRPGFALWRRLARRRQVERKMRATAEPGPGFWHRLDAGLARARSLALSTTLLLALGLLGWAIRDELARNPVIIEPLLVPELVAKAGWTGEVLARQMRDRIREINDGATTLRRRDDYLFDGEQLNVVLPGGLVSIRTLVTVIRGVFNLPARRFVGEVVNFDGPVRPAECDKTTTARPTYVLIGRLSFPAHGWIVCGDAVRQLPVPAADGLMLRASAYVLASYHSSRNPAQAQTIAELILRDKNSRNDHAWAASLLGFLLAQRGEFANALVKYEQATAIDENFTYAYMGGGNVLLKLNRPLDAITKFEQAIRTNTKYADAYTNWGYALRELKRPHEAIAKYKQAIRIDPNRVYAYSNWGYALSDLKRFDEAIAKYEQAIRIDPKHLQGYTGWGDALADLKRPDDAIVKYEEAIGVDPNSADAYYGWGNALSDLKRPEEAIGKYEQAIRIDPNYADAFHNWGVALSDLNRTEEAEAMFAKARCLRAGQSVESCTAAGNTTAAGRVAPRAPE